MSSISWSSVHVPHSEDSEIALEGFASDLEQSSWGIFLLFCRNFKVGGGFLDGSAEGKKREGDGRGEQGGSL